MRHALLPLFLATPASAQSVADFGGTGCRLIPVEGQSQVADVICHNAITSGDATGATARWLPVVWWLV